MKSITLMIFNEELWRHTLKRHPEVVESLHPNDLIVQREAISVYYPGKFRGNHPDDVRFLKEKAGSCKTAENMVRDRLLLPRDVNHGAMPYVAVPDGETPDCIKKAFKIVISVKDFLPNKLTVK